MTQKRTKNDGQNVAVDMTQMKSVLAEQPDFLVPVVQEAVQAMLEVEMAECHQAGKHERSEQRLGYRSGYYRRRLITRGGTIVLRVPQDRAGQLSTQVFEQYQRNEKALAAALAQMHVQGVSMRKVAAITQEGEQAHGAMALRRVRRERGRALGTGASGVHGSMHIVCSPRYRSNSGELLQEN